MLCDCQEGDCGREGGDGVSCPQCVANCPDEERERFARKCWLAQGRGEPVPECEDFKEQSWRGGAPRHLWRKAQKQRPQRGVRHGRS